MLMKKQKNYLKSFTLFEALLSLILISIIIAVSLNLLNSLNQKNKLQYDKTIMKLEFENFRFFLENKIKTDKKLQKLSYIDNKILYENSLLLDNVVEFKKDEFSDFFEIYICLKNKKNCLNLVIK